MNEFDNKPEEKGAENTEIAQAVNDETVYLDLETVERGFSAAKLSVGNEAEEEPENASDEASDETLAQPEEKKEKASALTHIYDYVETFCYALSLMMILFLFVFRYVSVDGDSMMDTLHNKDKLIISDLFYTPKTGDIVVINPESHGDNGEPIIKRVIATEGQKVYIDYEKWEVYVDGVKLDEPYIETMRKIEQQRWGEDIAMNGTSVAKYKSEFTVGEDKVFVMGDNRNNSKDSRSREYGEMDENRILGRVIVRISPDFGKVE